MSDDQPTAATVRFTSRQLWVIALVTFLAVTGVGLASHFSQDVAVSNGLTFSTSGTGVEVEVTGSFHPDLSGDWAGSDNVRIITGEGNMTVTASGAADLDVAPADIEGTWTVVTNIDGTPSITVNPDDKAPVTLGTSVGDDRIDRFNFTASMAPDDGQLDFAYAEDGGDFEATVEGSFTSGTQYGAVDADNNVGLDVAVADANNRLTFDELPASIHDVEIQELGTLFIREETAPHDTVTGCNATVRFFEQEDDAPVIVERTDDGSGQINLTGLPVDEQFIASVKCGGYHNRTVLLNDLSQQETIFLLDKNRTAVENRFTVEDNTGEFPAAETQIFIQKAINRSHYGGDPSGFSWTTIAGDDVGADEAYVVDLEEEDRYRIIVQNDDGETRILGAYVPETTGTIPLTIGQVSFSGDTQAGAAFGAGLREHDDGSRDIQVVYYDEQDVTSQLRVRVRNESSGNVFYDSTTSDPSQRHVETVPLTGQDGDSFTVIVNATRDGQPDLDDTESVGDVGTLFDFDIDPQILSLLGWVIWLAFTLFFALRSPVMAPAASVIVAAGLVAVGVFFVPAPLLGIAGAVGILVLMAGRGR